MARKISPERNREKTRRWRLANPEKARAMGKAWRAKAKDWIRDYNRRWAAAHPDRVKANSRAVKLRLKLEMVAALGGGGCACCGETEIEFLTLDHIGGGGNQHRKELGLAGSDVWRVARREGWPREKYRCLCFNCNSVYWLRGNCPHQREPLTLVVGGCA